MLTVGLVLISLSAGPAVPATDRVPRFDIAVSCDTANKAASGIGRPVQACLDDEEKARTALEMRWSEYPIHARQSCTESVSVGGPPSYVQLITCLEMRKQ